MTLAKLSYLQSLVGGENTSCQCELRCLTADGGFRWLDAHAWPLWDADGNIIGISGCHG